MCIYWVCKYLLCGCIWDDSAITCSKELGCTDLRMVQVQIPDHKCEECHARDRTLIDDTAGGLVNADGEHSKVDFRAIEFVEMDLSRVCDAVHKRDKIRRGRTYEDEDEMEGEGYEAGTGSDYSKE
ncbi:hypothetical protein ASPZODRAFT_199168 [Penicilliopsis zonata CBS 506.65]|uniref:Uncharacterized protein n=1 Tax=Penicilliopsis zonata CBS 506.65 TaxID=1073090 RepID=A0A1L9STT4_9EURO|nr:hypothetical protein ASPZODRAFT_199168 [Penicilliopsis zonata CBS 506.65]OJJ50531.1 hypothetical protein ASPZODRAFT_199168 [Penicilliopsis zonata CBS 506.65]